MSSKIKSVFVCEKCGYENPKWYGRCPQCGEWDSLTEHVINDEPAAISKLINNSGKRGVVQKVSEIQADGER